MLRDPAAEAAADQQKEGTGYRAAGAALRFLGAERAAVLDVMAEAREQLPALLARVEAIEEAEAEEEEAAEREREAAAAEEADEREAGAAGRFAAQADVEPDAGAGGK